MKNKASVNVLVIGNGSREHAIAWKFSTSSLLANLYVAPGNAGTSEFATNVEADVTDINALLTIALKLDIDLTFVGPEIPLAMGIVDLFKEHGLKIVGPSKAAAQIEASKTFAKQLMNSAGIPTASFEKFTSVEQALNWGRKATYPLVVKVDGLAAGKGVIIANNYVEYANAIDLTLRQMKFGKASAMILVEEYLSGAEVSVFAFVDGINISRLTAAKDYKRVYDNDIGPNTGGMGSYSVPEFWDPKLAQEIRQTVFEPMVSTMKNQGIPFSGILYAGIMLTSQGPKVLEFNCRLGDPEAQVLLLRLESDLITICYKILDGNLSEYDVSWSQKSSVSVVVASKGYPDKYKTGYPLTIPIDLMNSVTVFHGGTTILNGVLLANGGRLFTVVALDEVLDTARRAVYKALENVECTEVFYRSDIANIDNT